MRGVIHILIVLCIPVISFGQLHGLSDQYIFNGLAINPAYAGNDDAFSAVATYRNQWVGFEGAPQTMSFSAHTPLGNEKIGIGLLLVNDQLGVNNETSIFANYAYRIKMGSARLSFGVGMGVTLLNADWDNLKVTDLTDQELINSSYANASPNFSAGVYYRDRDFFIGASIPMFLSYEYNPSQEEWTLGNDISEYNLYVTGGYNYEINRRLSFQPAGLLKYHPGNALQFDLYPQFVYNDLIWFGLGYRSIDTFMALLQVQLNNQFRLAYSYDFDIGETGKYNSGSHEVMLKYVFNVKSKVDGPGRF